jgi:putative CocE/NonD family hydrolase
MGNFLSGLLHSAGIIDAHPAPQGGIAQAPIADWFIGDDFHHNGTLYLPHMFRFFSSFGHPRPVPTRLPPPAGSQSALTKEDGYGFFLSLGPLTNVNEKFFKNDVPFWNEMTQHGTYDEYWQARDLRRHLKNIKPAVMTVGGWFDAEDLFGALNTYQEIEKNSPGANNMLVMGPWYHGGWARNDGESLGRVPFNSKTGVFYREKIELPFFNYWLKGKADPKLPEAFVFETGANQWRREDAWPPKDAQRKTLYFQAEGKLGFDPPKDSGNPFDEYVSDPNKPVPYIGGQAPGMTREHMVEDQRLPLPAPTCSLTKPRRWPPM